MNHLTIIYNHIFEKIKNYDLNNTIIEDLNKNIEIWISCLMNYYKIKLNILLYNNISIDEKLNIICTQIIDIYSKITLLDIDDEHKNIIYKSLLDDFIKMIDDLNSQIITLNNKKDINTIYKYFLKINYLEKNLIKMNYQLNLTFSKHYEVLMMEKIVKLFADLQEKLQNINNQETYENSKENGICKSYFEMCLNIKYISDNLSKIDIPIINNFIKMQVIEIYDKYYNFLQQSKNLSLENNYLLLNTLGKIGNDLLVLELNSNDLTKKYDGLYCEIFDKITSSYTKRISHLINTNFNSKVAINCSENIFEIFNGLSRYYLDEDILYDIFVVVCNKLSFELVILF